jgi:hypothetical protein
MKIDQFESWLQNIYDTQDEEIYCTECFDLVSHYVELELSGGNPAVRMPQVTQHLNQCPTCREEYLILRDLRRLENGGWMPSVDDLRDLIH